jgi:DNA-binding NtrC family response regulator
MKEKLNVLLIEDSLADEKLLVAKIKKDYQVSLKRIENEEQFRDELNKALPDIILSDYNLPSFNGMDALKIRRQIAPLVPFILITGTLNEETAVEVMKAGADDYILKDSLKRLSPVIDSALNKMANLKAKEDAELKLREVLEHSVNLFYSHDINGVLTYVSPQAKNYLGCEPEEAMTHWVEFITDNPVNGLGVESTN